VLWVLLAAVPAVFIVFATALAPGSRVRLSVDENGRQVSKMFSLAFGAGIHPAFMAPMAIVSLATLAGMFIILDSRAGDQRLVLAGQRAGAIEPGPGRGRRGRDCGSAGRAGGAVRGRRCARGPVLASRGRT
jgi:hypothetical protein